MQSHRPDIYTTKSVAVSIIIIILLLTNSSFVLISIAIITNTPPVYRNKHNVKQYL